MKKPCCECIQEKYGERILALPEGLVQIKSLVVYKDFSAHYVVDVHTLNFCPQCGVKYRNVDDV